jgi:hypothetical protein
MARTTSTGRRTSARAVAGLAPLALALLLQRAVLPGAGSPRPADSTDPTVCTGEIDDESACHTQFPTGCSAAARYDGYLNALKNQLPGRSMMPVRTLGASDFDELNRKTPTGISKDNHIEFKEQLAQLGEGRLQTVVGYLYYAKKGGKESVNCQLEGEDAIDFHLALGFDAALAAKVLAKQSHQGKLTAQEESDLKKTSIIVEMTPHYRARFQPDWTLDAVKAAIGHQVKVTGLLMLDNEHQIPSDNCALGNHDDCWRASTWELHPVTQFQVCNADICANDSNAWVELGEPLDGAATAPKTTSTK